MSKVVEECRCAPSASQGPPRTLIFLALKLVAKSGLVHQANVRRMTTFEGSLQLCLIPAFVLKRHSNSGGTLLRCMKIARNAHGEYWIQRSNVLFVAAWQPKSWKSKRSVPLPHELPRSALQ